MQKDNIIFAIFSHFPTLASGGKHSAWTSTRSRPEAQTHYLQKKQIFVGRGLAHAERMPLYDSQIEALNISV